MLVDDKEYWRIMDNNEIIKLGRQFTKFDDDESYQSDQELNKPQPPLVKENRSREVIELPMPVLTIFLCPTSLKSTALVF